MNLPENIEKEAFKLVLSGSKGAFRRINISLKTIGGGSAYQAEKYTDRQVFHDNIKPSDLRAYLEEKMEDFRQLDCFAPGVCRTLRISKKGRQSVVSRPSDMKPSESAHNKTKNRLLKEGEIIPPLVDMGVFTPEGRVASKMQDKYRQINRFMELLDDGVRQLKKQRIRIIDFGCGKSYLTFVVYYFLKEVRGLDIEMTGLDLKADVIDRCNETAKKYGYDALSFCLGDIAGYKPLHTPDIVISLHACDTATDYAIFNALSWGTEMIYSVPCCQHELNGQIKGDRLSALTKYGIIKERFSALMTDAIRGCLVESAGYKTELLEFVDLAHSPKNILIRARRASLPQNVRERSLRQAEELMEEFSLSPCLYRLMKGEQI